MRDMAKRLHYLTTNREQFGRDLSGLDTSWMDQAACRGVDPGLFFPERGARAAFDRIRAICETCPVQVECLEYALEINTQHGFWGGKSERERRRMRRERKAS